MTKLSRCCYQAVTPDRFTALYQLVFLCFDNSRKFKKSCYCRQWLTSLCPFTYFAYATYLLVYLTEKASSYKVGVGIKVYLRGKP